MVSNTGNGATLEELPDKSQISEKQQMMLLMKIEKKESKNLFRVYQSILAGAMSTIIVGRTRSVKEMLIKGN